MAHPFSCPRGHQWESAAGAAAQGPAVCPVCGAKAVADRDATLAAPPRAGRTTASVDAAAPTLPPPTRQLVDEAPSHGKAAAGADVTLAKSAAATRSDAPAQPRDEAPSFVGPTIPGYVILGELGRGGMGVVYKARQVGLNRLVALKMILSGAYAGESELARFRLEAEAIAKLQHPHIVQVHAIDEVDGKPFFCLEFVEGGGLDRKLAGNPQAFRQAAELAETLARAMDYAHKQGVIHRDLKPANILLTADGVPKITDFGLAKKLDDQAGQTQSGSIMGTPSYMAPEQAAGRTREIGAAADIFSLGAILYETLVGRPPFKGETVLDTLDQVRTQEPVHPSRLRPKTPRDLETICLKCLQKDPRKRYASAGDLAEDLRRYLAGEPILARPMGRAERMWRWCRRNPVPASLLLTVTLGSAFGMWYLSGLTQSLIHSTALEGAAQQAETFDELNDYYATEVVDRATPAVTATAGYKSLHGTIPPPATLTIDFGDYLSDHSARGTRVRLYSDFPFRNRTDGGVHDAFEQEALEHLRARPDQPYSRFEDYNGRPVLRYATARVMKEACVNCHNSHPDSTKTDWKVGEVRGVLELIRPLDNDEKQMREGLFGTFALVAGVSAGLLALSTCILILSNRRRRAP